MNACGGLNQYLSAGAASFTYDSNGYPVTDGSLNLVYNAENRMVTFFIHLDGTEAPA